MGNVLTVDDLRIFLEKACIVTLGKPQELQDDDDDLFSFGMMPQSERPQRDKRSVISRHFIIIHPYSFPSIRQRSISCAGRVLEGKAGVSDCHGLEDAPRLNGLDYCDTLTAAAVLFGT